ncbi:hypothetical protein [Brevundimonas vesicularis]|uniref:hypothetical protein n=1 Tax=Brevundimonas vesicularis TaxID=41276 RepID=UPI0038507DA5
MRRALAVSIVLTAVNLAAGAAVAQQAPTNASGLRYLSWPGKPPAGARATPAPTLAVTQAEAPSPTVSAANRTLPGAMPLARLSPARSGTTPRSNGLTPASAWMPQRAPTQAEPAHSAPVGAAPVDTAPAQATRVAPSPYVPEPQPSNPQRQPEPQMQAEPAPVPQQAAQAEPQPAPQPAQAAVADPMAPRRDAPIYRLQRPQAGVPVDAAAVAASDQAAQAPTAGDNSARYYSVHRQAGRHPDTIPAPQQTYLDALPVQMAQTPQSSDLAQPDGPPALIRNANGSLRAVPQTEADNLP